MRTRSAAFLLLTLGLAACEDGARGDLSDWSEHYSDTNPEQSDDGGASGDGGSTIPDDITAFAVRAPADLGYDVRLTEKGDSSTACELTVPDDYTGYQSMDCILEMNELDLYGNGLDFEVTIPEGACDYVLYWHYMYQAFPIGVGPDVVSYTVTTDAEITDEVNIINGVPYCEYDYSLADNDAPNCCLGSFRYVITYEQEGGPPEVIESPYYDWGGDPAECFAGAAYLWPEASFTEDGWPTGTIEFVDLGAWYRRFTWDELSSSYWTNVNLANYYDPADHDGSLPAGFQPLSTDVQAAIGFAVDPNPYYHFQCTDNAWEVKAELRLQVREWNEEVEFYAEGDPDSGEGDTEAGSGSPLNDVGDWRDVAPGDSTFNGLVQ